jgi:hypothetical protein
VLDGDPVQRAEVGVDDEDGVHRALPSRSVVRQQKAARSTGPGGDDADARARQSGFPACGPSARQPSLSSHDGLVVAWHSDIDGSRSGG